jgi:hypothetical protein
MKVFTLCSIGVLALATTISPALAQGQGFGAKSGQAASSPDLSGLTNALSGLSSGTANPTSNNTNVPANP